MPVAPTTGTHCPASTQPEAATTAAGAAVDFEKVSAELERFWDL